MVSWERNLSSADDVTFQFLIRRVTMKRTMFVLVSVLVLVSMVLSACGAAPTPTPVQVGS